MQKDFDKWNEKKKQIDTKENIAYFKAGEVWWVHIGLNIGTESNGKSEKYLRPLLILKKFNKHSFLSLPLSSSSIKNSYRMPVGNILNKAASINLSQIQYRDSKRLEEKICTLDTEIFEEIKKKASQIILTDSFHIISSTHRPDDPHKPEGHNYLYSPYGAGSN